MRTVFETVEQMVEEIRIIQDKLDKIREEISSLPGSRETSIAITKVEETILWLEKRITESQKH